MCKQNVCRQDIENTFLFHSESGSVLKILHNRIENQRQFRKKNLICTWNTLKGVYGIGQYLSTEKPPIYVICTDIFRKNPGLNSTRWSTKQAGYKKFKKFEILRENIHYMKNNAVWK